MNIAAIKYHLNQVLWLYASIHFNIVSGMSASSVMSNVCVYLNAIVACDSFMYLP
jgi:hypothetical protein